VKRIDRLAWYILLGAFWLALVGPAVRGALG
jgi:hypothetical protein